MDDSQYAVSHALGSYVTQRFREAKEAKRVVFDDLLECLRLIEGDTRCQNLEEIDVSVNVVAPIVRNIVGLLRDIFASSAEAPFVVKPTPIVDLSEESVNKLRDQLRRDLPSLVAQVGGDMNALEEELRGIKQAMMLYESSEAAKAAEKMFVKVSDDMHDGGWLNEFGDFLQNFVTYRAAILKTPVHNVRKWKQWSGFRVDINQEVVRGVENISPFDFYLAPNGKKIQDCEYVIERRTVTRNELLDYTRHPELNYSVEGIMHVLEHMPDGHTEEYENGEGDIHAMHEYLHHQAGARDEYTAIGFYGRLRGNYLAEHGVEVPDPLDTYESVVWVIGGVVIQALLNPDELGRRPFYGASFEPIPGKFWGNCPTLRLKDIQRVCTASIVNLVKNMGFAGGPIGEVDMSRVDEDETNPEEIHPYQLKMVDSRTGSVGAGSVYKFHKIDSHATELTGIFDKFLGYGYEILGIPRIAFGSSAGLGEVGRTSGGLSMLMNQAAKAIKFAMRVLEEYVIEPVVQDYIDYNLMYSLDPSIKGDVRAYARGVSGIMEQSDKIQSNEWALQSIVPMMQIADPTTGRPILPAEAPLRLIYDLFKLRGIPTEGILPDFDLQAEIYGGVPRIAPPLSQAGLDGRSANAAGAINNMNNLGG